MRLNCYGSVLFDPESAQASLGVFAFLGAAERKALYMLSICLSLGKEN